MRTTFLGRAAAALALAMTLALGAAAQRKVDVGQGKSFSCTAQGTRTVCTLAAPGKRFPRVVLMRDATVRSGTAPALKLVGAGADGFVMVDSYASGGGGLGYCGAGTESFLRVFALGAGGAALKFQTKLESCRENVELALDGLRWDAAAGAVHVHWLSAPKSGVEMEKTLVLSHGAVEEK